MLTLDSHGRTRQYKEGPEAADGDSEGTGRSRSQVQVTGVWGRACQPSDLRGWREGEGSTFCCLSQDFLKADSLFSAAHQAFLWAWLSHTHTWASSKASSTWVLLVTLSPKSSVRWK